MVDVMYHGTDVAANDGEWYEVLRLTRHGRPNWSDPNWYQAVYAYSAANLNLAIAMWTVSRFVLAPDDGLRTAIQADLGTYLTRFDDLPDGRDALRKSAHSSRMLLMACIHRFPGREPRQTTQPRHVITRHRREALKERTLWEFIHSQVHDPAITVVAGALQLRDLASGNIHAGGTRQTPMTDRDIVVALGTDEGPTAEDLIAVVEGSDQIDYRVSYNLACYYTRSALVDFASLSIARDRLAEAVNNAPDETRTLICIQAYRDPALTKLRVELPEDFKSITHVEPPTLEAAEASTHVTTGPTDDPAMLQKIWPKQRSISTVVQALRAARANDARLRISDEAWRSDLMSAVRVLSAPDAVHPDSVTAATALQEQTFDTLRRLLFLDARAFEFEAKREP